MDRNTRLVALNRALTETETLDRIVGLLAGAEGRRQDQIARRVNRRLDHLMATLLDSFPDEGITTGSVRPLLARHYDLTSEGLIDLADALIPLVIIREFVSHHHWIVKQADVPNWERFTERFKAVCYA